MARVLRRLRRWRKRNEPYVYAVLSHGQHSHDSGQTWHPGGSLIDLLDCEAEDV